MRTAMVGETTYPCMWPSLVEWWFTEAGGHWPGDAFNGKTRKTYKGVELCVCVRQWSGGVGLCDAALWSASCVIYHSGQAEEESSSCWVSQAIVGLLTPAAALRNQKVVRLLETEEVKSICFQLLSCFTKLLQGKKLMNCMENQFTKLFIQLLFHQYLFIFCSAFHYLLYNDSNN